MFEHFWAVIALTVVWALLFAATMPIRQAYMNGLIPSRERATILSFDSLMSCTGGVWAQPVLGRAADVWGYAPTLPDQRGDLRSPAPVHRALSRRQHPPRTRDRARRRREYEPHATRLKQDRGARILSATDPRRWSCRALVPFAHACVRAGHDVVVAGAARRGAADPPRRA